MPSLFEQIPDINRARNLVTQQAGILSQLGFLVSEFSLEDINQVTETLRSFSIPQVSDFMGTLTIDLKNLTEKLPSDPSEIIGTVQKELVTTQEGLSQLLERSSALTAEITRFRSLIPQTELFLNLINHFNPIIDKLMEVKNLALSNPRDILNFFTSVLPADTGMDQIPFLSTFRGILETIVLWMGATSEELSDFIQGKIETFSSQIGTPMEGIIQEAIGKIPLDNITPVVTVVEERRHELLSRLSDIKGLNLTEANQLNLARSRALDVQNSLNLLYSQVTQLVTTAETDLKAIQIGSLGEELQQKLFFIQETVRIENIENSMENVAAGVSTFLKDIDLEKANSELEKILLETQSKLDIFDFSGIKEQSSKIADGLNTILNRVDEFQIQTTVAIKNLFQEIDETINRVNLEAIKTSIQDALNQFQEQIAPLQNQLSSLALKFTQFLNTVNGHIQEFDSDFVRQEIETLLLHIQNLLGDSNLQATVESVSNSLQSMTEKLDQITFEPVIDSVILEIDKMKTELAQIDVSSLNEFLIGALKVAVEVLKKIRFEEEISEVLIAEFQQVRDVPTKLTEALTEKSDELLKQIEQFNPEELLIEPLSKPLESLKENLEKIRPSVLFQPILAELEKIIAKIQDFAPSQLVAPLAEMQNQLLSALQSLSPGDIIAPLTKLLNQFNELIDQINISALIKDLEKSVESGRAIFNSFALSSTLSSVFEVDLNVSARIEEVDFGIVPRYLEQLLNQLLSKLDQINIVSIENAINQLSSTLDKIDLKQFKNQFNEKLNNYQAVVNRVDLMPLITEITQRWRELKSHLSSITPPESLQPQYNELLSQVASLNPVAKLSPIVSGFDGIKQQLQRLNEESNRMLDALTVIAEITLDQIRDAVPQEVNKDSLKEIVREAFSTLLLRPLGKIFQAVEGIMPGLKTFFAKVEGFLDTNKTKLMALLNPLSFLEPIQTALGALKEKIQSIDLSFLTEELLETFRTLEGKIQSLNISDLVSGLDEVYQSFLSNIQRTLSAEIAAELNQIYTGIAAQVNQIDIESMVEPLREIFDSIRELAKIIDAEVLFRPLIEKMDVLFNQLESGLERSGKAFGQMITAIPV